jgi:hypothetical protein
MSPEGSGTPPTSSGNTGYHPKRQSKRRETQTPGGLGRSAPDMRRADHPRTAPLLRPSCCVLSILAKVSRKVTVRLKTRPFVTVSTASTQK